MSPQPLFRSLLPLPVAVAAAFLLALAGSAAAQNPEDTFRDAANFQNNKAYDLAIEEWQKFLKAAPEHKLATQARHYLGVCYLQLKTPQFDKAAEAFEQVVKTMEGKDPPKFDQLEESYLNLGWSQFTLAQAGKKELYPRAIAAFEAEIKKFPKGPHADQAAYFLADAWYFQGDKAKAAAAYKQVVDNYPMSAKRCDALYALGVTYEELNQFEQAGPVYDLFLSDCKTSELATEVRMRKAETVLQGGLADEKAGKGDAAKAKFAEAEKTFTEVGKVEGFVSADHALYRLALCDLKLGKNAEAAAAYAKVAANPKSAYVREAAMAAGRCYYQAKQPDEARKFLDQARAAGGADAVEAAHWLAKLELAAGQPAKAYELATATLGKEKEGAYLVALQMDQADALYEQAGEKAKSIPLYVKIQEANPSHELAAQALYNAAFAALEVNDYDAGLKHSAAFLEKYKQDRLVPDVKFVAAECNLFQKKYPEAEKIYTDLAATAKGHAAHSKWLVRLGLVAFLQQKYKETIAALEPALPNISGGDSVAEAQYLLGASQLGLDQTDAAVKALNASLAANAKWRQSDEVLLSLARALGKQKKYPEAAAAAQRVIAEFPQSQVLDQANYRLGEFAFAAGDFAGAAGKYDVVVGKFPQSLFAPHALYGKALSLVKQGDQAKAIEALTTLITAHASHALVPQAHGIRATARQGTGDFKGALEDVTAYLKSNPKPDDRSDALYVQALSQIGLKDHAAAAVTLDTILKENANYAGGDKVLYELAWAHKSAGKDAEAVATFAKLAKEKPESGFAAESLFHIGQQEYADKKWAEAAKSYAAARDALPKAKEAAKDLPEKILYKLGWSQFQLKQYEPSLASFKAQAEQFPGGPLIGDANFMIAENLFRQEKFEPALAAFEKAKGSPASNKDIEMLILLHGGQSAGQAKKWDESLKLLGELVTKHPQSPYLAEAQYEQGWAQQNLKKYDEAAKLYTEAATNHRGDVGARARFMLGEIFFTQKQHDAAVKEFLRVMFGYGGEAATEDVKKWQAKAGYEAGRCSEVQIKDEKDAAKRQALLADALKYYGYVVEKHPSAAEKAESANRVKELGKLK